MKISNLAVVVALAVLGGILVASGIHSANVSTMARGLLSGRGAA